MVQKQSKLKRWIVGAEEINKAQLKFYSSIAGDLAKALVLASGAILVYPFQEDWISLIFAVLGLFTAMVLFISASRMLKEVKDV